MARIVFALSGVALAALVAPASAQDKPAPVAALIRKVDIAYSQFTLKNGLRVIVHTDRKAPVVAVSVWYDVGSKFEPKGKSGFAHLFEHIMFNGSENAPGDFFEPIKQVGGTNMNGSTTSDRTNYFETVPRGALDRVLFLESDRMGYLLGAITQTRVDKQRGVVQNEKRGNDNQPYGLVQYKLNEGLFPPDHPYGHTTIGSMADLDAASLADVKSWFRDHYGPNNAVVALAGDIDVATARLLMEKYFGGIPREAQNKALPAPVPTLAVAKSDTIKDRVGAVMISRNWAVPGIDNRESIALDVAAGVLGGLSSSRLENALVRREKLATSVSAYNSSETQVGTFTVQVSVRPGVDPAVVATRLDALIADFLQTGPTAEEVQRYITSSVAGKIAGLEAVGGKAAALASGALFLHDPDYYKEELVDLAAQTPAHVKAVADTWLRRPVYALTVEPGPRDAYAEAQVPPQKDLPPDPVVVATGARGAMPGTGAVPDLSFPKVERSRLSNGIELVYAQRDAVPYTRAVISFDAGVAADVPGRLGTQRLTVAMLSNGTTTRNSIAIAEAKEGLGVGMGAAASLDRTYLTLGVPSANLGPAIDLFADVTRHPAFAPDEVARVRNQQLATIRQELTSPGALGTRVMPRLLYGPDSPYARMAGGTGDPKAVALLSRDDLIAFQHAWLRPDKAKIFVVSDRPLTEVKALFEQRFGDWRGEGPAGVKSFAAPFAPATPRIVLIDRPDSPQSTITGAIPTTLKGSDELIALVTANDALGGNFLSRINMDLREGKHWAYGAGGGFQRSEHAAPYSIGAPVQADKTGASIAALTADVTGFVTTSPITQGEFDRAIASAIRQLPGSFETSEAVLSAMQTNDLFRRPDNYYATITQKYRGLTRPQLDAAAKATLDPAKLIWVIVGDAKTVRPQLDSLGLPVEVVPAASVADAK